MNSLLTRALIVTTGLLAIAACGDDNKTQNTPQDTTVDTATPDHSEVLRYETTGGCLMMGPNCATYVVYSDGAVEIYRDPTPNGYAVRERRTDAELMLTPQRVPRAAIRLASLFS